MTFHTAASIAAATGVSRQAIHHRAKALGIVGQAFGKVFLFTDEEADRLKSQKRVASATPQPESTPSQSRTTPRCT